MAEDARHSDLRHRRANSREQGESRMSKLYRAAVKTPLSVGGLYTPSEEENSETTPLLPGPQDTGTRRSDGSHESKSQRGDGLFASVYFLLFIVVNRTIIYVFVLVANDERHKSLWYSMKAIDLIWQSSVCFLQALLCARVFNRIKWPAYMRFHITPSHQGHDQHVHPYFRIAGMLLFGLGTIGVYSVLLYDIDHCLSYLQTDWKKGLHYLAEMVNHFFLICIMILQTLFLCRVCWKSYTFDNNAPMRYTLLYIASNNMLIYMYHLIAQGKEAYDEAVDDTHGGNFSNCDLLWNTDADKKLHRAEKYLSPFIAEYNLFALEMMLHIWSSMSSTALVEETSTPLQEPIDTTPSPVPCTSGQGRLFLSEHEDGCNDTDEGDITVACGTGLHEDDDCLEDCSLLNHIQTEGSNQAQYELFMARHQYLIIKCGIFMAILSLADAILEGFIYRYSYFYLLLIQRAYLSVLRFGLIIITIYGFNLLPNQLKKNISSFTGTEILLMICCAGHYLYYTCVFCSSLFCIAKECHFLSKDDNIVSTSGIGRAFPYVRLVEITLRGIFFWFQTQFLILCGKTVDQQDGVKAMLLKCVFVVLGVYDLFRWAEMSFVEINIDALYTMEGQMIGKDLWAVFQHLTLPLGIFYYIQAFLLHGNNFYRLAH